MRGYDAILERVLPVLSGAIDRLIETTIADRASLWIVNADPQEMTCWVSGRLNANKIIRQRIPSAVDPSPTIPPRLTERVAGRRSIVVQTYRKGAPLKATLNRSGSAELELPKVWRGEGHRYRSVLCIPVFFNQVPMGSLLIESRLPDAFSEDDERYVEGVKTAMEAVVENIYRRNDFQWLIDRLHSDQATHDLNGFAHEEKEHGRISSELFSEIQTYLLGVKDFNPQGPSITAEELYVAVSEKLRQMSKGRRRLGEALLRNLQWRLPTHLKIRPLIAESITLIIENFAGDIIKAKAFGGPEGTQLSDMIKIDHYVNGKDRVEHVEIKCFVYGNIDPIILNQLGIAPITTGDIHLDPNVERQAGYRMKFGLFLVGVLARMNGGALEVHRRMVVPPHKRDNNRQLPRMMRAVFPIH
jgi:hypothetical protein